LKIYTKTGDEGLTSLVYGKRVSKADLKIEAYGTIDELNANLGLLIDQPVNEKRGDFLRNIQNLLFSIGSNLASEKKDNNLPKISESDVLVLEKAIDEMTSQLPDLKHFIIPGGHNSISICHIVRTVSRRAERTVVRLNEIEELDVLIIVYLNRLSDYLFTLARKIGQELGVEEVKWDSKK
jgi:cob(I)alamin adenosyltransferase